VDGLVFHRLSIAKWGETIATMRIGIVLINWGIGGSEKRFANLFNYLRSDSAHQYTLIINRFLRERLAEVGIDMGGEGVHELLTDSRWQLFDKPAPRVSARWRVRGVNFVAYELMEQMHRLALSSEYGVISEQKYDVVHYVFPHFADQLGTPRAKVLSCQDTNLQHTLLRDKFFLRALHSDGFFDIASERIKATLVAQSKINDDHRMQVGPCSFVDYSRTYVGAKEPLLAFVGRLDANKNPLLFVDVVQRVRKSFPAVRAVIMGDGPLRSAVEQCILRYQIQDVVKVSFCPKPESVLSRALIFFSIQGLDNYHSQALMEAMACGCAIVASDVGETYRLVSDKVGFRAQLDAEQLAEKALWLLHNAEAARQLGLQARKKVMSEQTIERFVGYLENLYVSAAGSGNALSVST
jgi:glycosyltransferase involved in cell wall biosynthesis